MSKKISKATMAHFLKTADCNKLTKPQLAALQTLSYRDSPRKERFISSLPYQYQTLEALVARRAAKFRSFNRDTGRFMYVCITEFGNQIALLNDYVVDTRLVLDNVFRSTRHVTRALKSGMRHLGVPIPEEKR